MYKGNIHDWWYTSPESPFHVLNDKVRKEIESDIKLFPFKKREIIYREGFQPHGLFLIKSGKAKVYKTGANGRAVIIKIAAPHDILGYDALLKNVNYFMSAETIEDSELYLIPKQIFYELIKNHADLSLALMQNFLKEYDIVLQKLADLVSNQTRKRVAEALAHLVKVFGFEPDNKTINISLQRE